MTFTTLQYNGVEKTLADWGIATARRQVSNQAGDNFAFDMITAADAPDPFPYGAQITVRIGRVGQVGPSGLPLAGQTSFSGGKIWFVGYRVETFRSGSPALEKLDHKFAGPWEFFFERLVFQKLWWTFNGTENVADWRSEVILGLSPNALVGPGDTVPGTNATCLTSIRQQLVEIIQYVIAQTTAAYGSPQLQSDPLTADSSGLYFFFPPGFYNSVTIPDYTPPFSGNGATTAPDQRQTLRAPLHAANDITCAEAIRYMLRWVGALGTPVVWFDYTQSPPQIRIATRDQLPSVNLPAVGLTESLRIKRRDDLIPSAVALKFRVTTTYNSSGYTQVIHDIASNISGSPTEGFGLAGALYPIAQVSNPTTQLASGTQTALQNAARTFAAQSATIDMEGGHTLIAAITCDTVYAGDPAAGGNSLTFWTRLFPELAGVSNLAFYDASNAPATFTDDSGNPVDLTTCTARLTDGQIAPWMVAAGGAAGLVKQCTVKAKFKYSENAGPNSGTQVNHKIAAYHEKTARVTLTNLQGGTYQTGVPGEVIPYGLAGYIYAIESIPQYEGTFTLVEPEITDQCPPGNNLNLTGSANAEWAAMNACIQSIAYDLTTGKTTLTFGPAAHLGAKDLVERLRVNRGPRWYYQIGSNMTNAGGNPSNQLGSNIRNHGPSPANPVQTVNIDPASLPDWITNAAAYADGVPGITRDTAGAVAYGGLAAPNAPTLFLASGSGGSLTKFARLDAAAALNLQIGAGAQTTSNVWVRLDLADLQGATLQLYFREIPECDNIGGTLTNGYRLYLCSQFYTTSIG